MVGGSRGRFPVQVRVRRVRRGHAPRGQFAVTVRSWDKPEGRARSGDGIGLAKGCCVRAGSHGRGLHANRVGAVAGHAALNHVDTNFLASGRSWEAVESAPRSDQVRARCRKGAGRCRGVGGSTVEGLEPIGIVRRIGVERSRKDARLVSWAVLVVLEGRSGSLAVPVITGRPSLGGGAGAAGGRAGARLTRGALQVRREEAVDDGGRWRAAPLGAAAMGWWFRRASRIAAAWGPAS